MEIKSKHAYVTCYQVKQRYSQKFKHNLNGNQEVGMQT